ncbi:hypothetical protein C8R44DRAFT_750806 [Mycena epipterygia]|nr:hypothetical protein C8R44DRAFT_750806 [Mycena epipterygia]
MQRNSLYASSLVARRSSLAARIAQSVDRSSAIPPSDSITSRASGAEGSGVRSGRRGAQAMLTNKEWGARWSALLKAMKGNDRAKSAEVPGDRAGAHARDRARTGCGNCKCETPTTFALRPSKTPMRQGGLLIHEQQQSPDYVHQLECKEPVRRRRGVGGAEEQGLPCRGVANEKAATPTHATDCATPPPPRTLNRELKAPRSRACGGWNWTAQRARTRTAGKTIWIGYSRSAGPEVGHRGRAILCAKVDSRRRKTLIRELLEFYASRSFCIVPVHRSFACAEPKLLPSEWIY